MRKLKYEDLLELGLLSHFKFFELKGIAKKEEDSIENLGTIIVLSTEEIKVEPRIIETDSILAFHFSERGRFSAFFKNLFESKCLEVKGRKVSYEKSVSHIESKWDDKSMVVRSYKDSVPIEDSINEEFITQLDEPYDGFYDFCEDFLGKRNVGGGTSSWIEARIPFDEILHLNKDENMLRIKTQIDPRDINLRIIIHSENGAVFRLKKNLIDLNKERGDFVLLLPDETQKIVVFPVLKKKILGRFVFVEEPKYDVVEQMIQKWVEKYGYQPDKNYSVGNVSSLEWHVYHLLCAFSSCIWIGIKEGMWKEIFKEFGLEETVDFILRGKKGEKKIVLIECMQSYTTREGDIGERGIRKLIYLRDKFSELNYNVYSVFVCGQKWEDRKTYLKGKIREDIYYIFRENLERIEKNLNRIRTLDDLIEYCFRKSHESAISVEM